MRGYSYNQSGHTVCLSSNVEVILLFCCPQIQLHSARAAVTYLSKACLNDQIGLSDLCLEWIQTNFRWGKGGEVRQAGRLKCPTCHLRKLRPLMKRFQKNSSKFIWHFFSFSSYESVILTCWGSTLVSFRGVCVLIIGQQPMGMSSLLLLISNCLQETGKQRSAKHFR